jgi:DnaJ-domain-containing protein 1
MSWEDRFFGAAPAALTAQVEGKSVWKRFTRRPPATPDEPMKLRVINFRFLHGVAGPDGPGLLLSFDIRGPLDDDSFITFVPHFGKQTLPSNLAAFSGPESSVLIANDLFGGEDLWTTKVFLPFAAVKETGAHEMRCHFTIHTEADGAFFEFTQKVPWPEPSFRDAMNAMSFTVHLLVSLMRVSGQLTPMDIQYIRRDLKRRYALNAAGLNILKRYMKAANKDPSSAQELGSLAHQGHIFSPSDHLDILEHLILFAEISGELTPEQKIYIQTFAQHAGFTDTPPFEKTSTTDSAPQHMGGTLSDAYRCLGLPTDADPRAIKKRYRHLVREIHPDRLQRASDEVQALANERLARINQAHELIQENLARF